MPEPVDPLSLLVAEREIQRIMTLYCRGADRIDYALLRSLFHDDAVVDFGQFKGGPDEFIRYVGSAPAVDSMQHHIGNFLIEIDGDHAEVETYCIARLGGFPTEAGPEDFTAFVRYLDRLELRDGQWRISRHVVIWDWNQHVPTTARWDGALDASVAERAKRGSTDASYRELPMIGAR